MLWRCTLMVPSTIFSRRPISLFDNPSDTRRMIWRSRSVSTVSTFCAFARWLLYVTVQSNSIGGAVGDVHRYRKPTHPISSEQSSSGFPKRTADRETLEETYIHRQF